MLQVTPFSVNDDGVAFEPPAVPWKLNSMVSWAASVAFEPAPLIDTFGPC
jgi:hypothetical protein